MKISVIVPCFNEAAVIGQQLEALAKQTVSPYEVIVADNGSTDSSLAVIEEYRDRLPRLKVIDAAGVKGASHARNAGAKVANSNYLAFCDADDVVDQGWLEALEQAFASHGFLACRLDNEMLNPGAVNTPQNQGLQNFRTPFYPFAGGCALAVRKDIHESVGGFDEAISHLEDADYCIRVQMTGHALTYVPEAVVHYRHGAGTKQSFVEARQATYRKAYNWGYGLATLYLRYRDQGMQLHGLAPRAVLIPLWGLRVLGTGFRSHSSLWRLGWHMGVVDRLLSTAEVPSPPVFTPPVAALAARS
ncbi:MULTISPECIES: glycosyltransferase family 2 protein [Cyanophyceae]|uniref:Glycosyltransferase family 2 protein n=1 Tax=Leptolyngbya subtilissima DQ-A4 TaxID=2933933 RepID=A0ABV0JZD8_9CYAN|nr:glycosyltransferase family A protein [Nodosilinea sp. FACHB-141]MBD2112518.1 glycosyltransferase family 2 protein [Nodosilinea sp. FACHB-141]